MVREAWDPRPSCPQRLMALENISRRPYPEADRNEVQERIARAIEADPEPFFAQYRALPQSFDGRYVCSDLFKETFPEFSVSPAARARYNNPLHNGAAVLASEQFRRLVQATDLPERDTVIFLTGVPGAGKTTAVLDNEQLPARVRLIYEGQLARPASVLPKIEAVLAAGLKPVIVAVHTPSEVALANTLGRFERVGRGASIEAMASIQGELPNGLAAIAQRFGDAVDFRIFDRRNGLNTADERRGWEHRSILESEGTYEQIRTRLTAALDRHEMAGTFGVDAIRQARGLATLARGGELSAPDGRELAHPRSRPAEGPQPGVAGSQEAGKADGALARGVEADQVRLRSQAEVGERYQTAIQSYLQSNTQQIVRIETRLQNLIATQQTAVRELAADRPGLFASASAKATWTADLEASRDRLQTLRGRLVRVEELKDQSTELAEETMRACEPELAREWDDIRQKQRSSQVTQQRARGDTSREKRFREHGREREL